MNRFTYEIVTGIQRRGRKSVFLSQIQKYICTCKVSGNREVRKVVVYCDSEKEEDCPCLLLPAEADMHSG